MGQDWGFNPACWAMQMDEDYMGVSSRMSRATHPLGAVVAMMHDGVTANG